MAYMLGQDIHKSIISISSHFVSFPLHPFKLLTILENPLFNNRHIQWQNPKEWQPNSPACPATVVTRVSLWRTKSGHTAYSIQQHTLHVIYRVFEYWRFIYLFLLWMLPHHIPSHITKTSSPTHLTNKAYFINPSLTYQLPHTTTCIQPSSSSSPRKP